MISSQQATHALYGAYRLARGDAGGMAYFNTTVRGFWQSFSAAWIVAPFFLLLHMIRFQMGGVQEPMLRYFAIEIVFYIIGWVLFPLVMYYLLQALEKEDRFINFVVAYNWAQAIQNMVYLPVAILFVLGIFSGPFAQFINLGLLGLVFLYTWFVTKTSVEISGGMAAAIVGLDVGIWILLNIMVESVLRSGLV